MTRTRTAPQRGFLGRALSTLAWAAAVIGPALIAAGLWITVPVGRFAERAEPVEVHVVGMDTRGADGDAVYRPVFEVRPQGGATVRHAGTFWVAPPPHAVGDVVPGYYDAATGEIRSLTLMAAQSAAGEGLIGLGIAGGLVAFVIFGARAIQSRLPAPKAPGD